MDDRRFDALTRTLAHGATRRQMLKALLGLGGAVAVTSVERETDAARRPTPTPKPITCPGAQQWTIDRCACPSGTTQCGPDCCPVGAQCCDNACCYGLCYGESLCCPSAQEWCAATAECCPAGEICCPGSGCQAPDDCCIPSCDGSTCGSDGCDGVCSCADNKVCSQGTCICPSGTILCPDGACRACCEYSNQSDECASTQGGDAGCWACYGPDGPGTPARACGPWSGGCPLTGGGTGYCGPLDHICYPNPA